MAPGRWPIGQCRVCLGWGELPQYADCGGCSSWRQLHPARTVCRRCGHDSHVNTDGVCRLCLQVIRADDAGWIADPTPGRPCQLALLVPGLRLPRAQPLDRPLHGRPRQDRPWSWLERLRAAGAQPVDDGRVCPPVLAGQLTLFRPGRRLTLDHARRIRDRRLPDHAVARRAVIARAAELGYGSAWWRAVELRLRLVLAVRVADGGGLLAEESLDDLPGFHTATADILHRLGLLQPRRSSRPAAITKPRRSCGHCGSWGFHRICEHCRRWDKHPVGSCSRCRRPGLPLLDGLCRACCVHVEAHGPRTLPERHVQLWLGGPLAPTLHTRAGTLGYPRQHHRARQRAAARRPPPPPVSPHLAVPGQGTLVEARRDWSCVAVGALEQLPTLTPAAHALLVEDFQRHVRDHHWPPEVRRLAARTLRIVLAWVGADAPIPEADIRSLPADRPGTSARRVVQFLAERNLLVPDPTRQLDPDERFVEQRIRALPADIGAEARRWVEVLRGEGRRAHPVTSFETIRKYVTYIYPALQSWADHHKSLREITPNDVQDVLREQTGNPARSLHTALRSLFRALKRERLVFGDPTRGITLPNIKQLPAPIPTDRLRGLIDRADGPMAQLAVALVAVHGLGPLELTRLHITDLDLARGRLLLRHDTWRRTVYLDELTLGLAAAWLRERQRRWPVTANPHLLVSQQTVVMDTCPAISRLAISLIFRRVGVAPSKLRQDRILDEADQTADPVHLMQVFGISARTAMHYVYAAHPERRSTLPR